VGVSKRPGYEIREGMSLSKECGLSEADVLELAMGSLRGCCRQSQNGDINAFNIARMLGTERVRLRRLELLKSLNLTFQRFLAARQPPIAKSPRLASCLSHGGHYCT
jgi:hypothetical protein